jgi:hypothetical protein
MKKNKQIQYLRESAESLQKSSEFSGLSIILLAIALEKQIKNVVIYNYRKSGLSASFIRSHLLKGLGYSDLLNELDWAAEFRENKKIKKIWKESKPIVSDLFGVMKTRNRLVHSVGGVSPEGVNSSVIELLFVIEKLSEIFEFNFNYNGLDSLPKSIKVADLNVSSRLFHKSITKNFNKV